MLNHIVKVVLDRDSRVIIPNVGVIIKESIGEEINYLFSNTATKANNTLTEAIMESMSIPHDEAENMLECYVDFIKKVIKKNGKYLIEEVGEIHRNDNKVYYFIPLTAPIIEEEEEEEDDIVNIVTEDEFESTLNKSEQTLQDIELLIQDADNIIANMEEELEDEDVVIKDYVIEDDVYFDDIENFVIEEEPEIIEEEESEVIEEEEPEVIEEEEPEVIEEEEPEIIEEEASEVIEEEELEMIEEEKSEIIEEKEPEIIEEEKKAPSIGRFNEQFKPRRFGETIDSGDKRRFNDRVEGKPRVKSDTNRFEEKSDDESIVAQFSTSRRKVRDMRNDSILLPPQEKIVEQVEDIEEVVEQQSEKPNRRSNNDSSEQNRRLQDMYGSGAQREYKFKRKDNNQTNYRGERGYGGHKKGEDYSRNYQQYEQFGADKVPPVINPLVRRGGKRGKDWVMIISIIIIILGLLAILYLYQMQQSLAL